MDGQSANRVKELLKTWKLSESSIAKFIEWQIDEDSFGDVLKEDELGDEYRSLLKLPIVDYLYFKIGLRTFHQNSETSGSKNKTRGFDNQSTRDISANNPHPGEPIDVVVNVIEKNTGTSFSSVSDTQDTSQLEELENTERTQPTKKQKTVLEQLLLKTIRGVNLLKAYNKERNIRKRAKIITADDQDFISRIVIDYELLERDGSQPNKIITPSRFLAIADDILSTFPTEERATYIRMTEDGKFISGKGKLYNRWTNVRRNASKTGVIEVTKKSRGKKRKQSDTEEIHELTTEDENEALTFLRIRREPFETIILKWRLTFDYRRRQLVDNPDYTPYKYAIEYLALQSDNGYKLLEEDFCRLYPGKDKNLFKRWSKLEEFILDQLTDAKRKLAINLTRSQKITFALSQMSSLFPVITVFKKKDGQGWRPSRSEVQESFMTHVKVLADLDTQASSRMVKLSRFDKKGLQPFIAIIAPTLKEIKQTFVYIYDEHRYEVEDPLTAVDIVFKCIHALHTPYPFEAQHLWQFIQRAIYDIDFDKVHNNYYPCVETLLKRFHSFEMD